MNIKFISAKVSIFAVLTSPMIFCGCENIQNLKADFNKWRKGESSKEVTQEGSVADAEPGTGEYFPVQKVTLKDSVSQRGVLSASERIDIRADKNLKLGPAKVATFAKVKKGELLFEVDTKDIVSKQIESKERLEQAKIDLDAAKTQLGFATKQLERKKVLAQKGITPKKELEDTEQAFEQADTAVQTKELDLKKAARENAEANDAMTSANIIAPIDGIVSKIDQGAKDVSEGHVLATISNMNSLSIYVVVDESMITRMPVGFPVEVSLDALQGKIITGVVKSAGKSAQGLAFSNNFEVKIDLPADSTKGENLNDGFEATVTAVFEERKEVLAIPKAAIKQSGDGTFVLVAKSLGGRPSPRKAKIGLQTELEVEVIEGLTIGEYVVVGKRG
jgi:RND family efflux transporter MFP subunit